MKIGFTENYIGKHCILAWFYEYRDGKWKRNHSQKFHPKHRDQILGQILQKADLVPLGRGT